MNCSVAASKLTNWPTAWCPHSPLWPPPPHYATVALPLLLSLFRLLAACECRCGCRFLSPINFLLIRSLFLHTHSRSCCTRAADNARTHTRAYLYVITAEYTFMHTYEAKKMNKNDDVVPVKYDTQIYSQLFALFIALGNIIQLQKRAVLTTFAPPYPLPSTPCPACRHLCHLQNKYKKKKPKSEKENL